MGVLKHGRDWKSIVNDPEFHPALKNRSIHSLKSKWGRLSKKVKGDDPGGQMVGFLTQTPMLFLTTYRLIECRRQALHLQHQSIQGRFRQLIINLLLLEETLKVE
jgi:hypothetical protein